MRLLIIFIIFIASSNLYSQGLGAELKYQPPFSPFSFSWSTIDGFKINLESSINTPAGEVSVEFSKGFSGEVKDKPIHIDVPRIEYRDRYIKSPPVIKIREIEKIKYVEVKSFILEVINYIPGESQEFLITGLDVFEIESDGKIKITAKEGRIIVDVLHSKVNSLKFRGDQFVHNDLDKLLGRLCVIYNDKFLVDQLGYRQRKNGFIVDPLFKGNEHLDRNGNGYAKEIAIDLMEDFEMTNPSDKVIAIESSSILISSNGIGLPIYKERKISLFNQFSENRTLKFFDWGELIVSNFEIDDSGKFLIIKDRFGRIYKFNGSSFSAVHYLRFFKNVINVIGNNSGIIER